MEPRVISVPNETVASFSRTTCDGRHLLYKLKVLQQPERARACGSGAKSSADRRPVDPPPIVELRIFDGEEHKDNDITFAMNANYFLFATLEQARPIAQGRVPNDPARLTVLTGTPVAGMVYLDRPDQAGYFIFPDLSVRHEGKYRLGFSLYEELKDPKDADQLDEAAAAAAAQGEAQITHRLEVKSQPFTVYSAKKFPGLASSTQLSRTVADQGCRVRIRREVRMRRREKGKDYDGYSDRGRHSATPDAYQAHMNGAHPGAEAADRERSASIASHASLAAAPSSRRPSGHDMCQTYPQPAYPPQAVAQHPGVQPAPSAQPQYSQAPVHQYAAPYAQQQAQMQPPPMQPSQPQMHYGQYQYPQAAAPAPAHQHATYYGYGHPAQQHAQYEEPTVARTMSVDYSHGAPAPVSADVRRHSMIQTPSYPHSSQPQAYSSQYQQAAYTTQQTPKMRQMSQASAAGAPAVAPHVLPPINTSLVPQTKLEVSPPSSAVSQSHYYDMARISENGQVNGKRSYDRVFDTRHLNGPLRQGARPSVSGYGHLVADDGNDSELAELESLKMSYRRADGREIARPLPPSHD
ncbi:hypothetical protein E4T52_06223 [Aureobasidium sp. EXF-3400]|nr:hypothetical protein E4T51_01369 [Aureobasidium sp. EXF-12344]KAI4778853.1 hypothetical protein E4T52_06223 [Aureobasidium sp. EXF-3400]